MQGQPAGSSPFQLTFLNHVPDATKGLIRETFKQQNKLGAKLTLRGYLSIKWKAAFTQKEGGLHPTREKGGNWAKMAISH